MNLGETIIYCGLGGLFLCGSILCSLGWFNIFGARAVFSMHVLPPLSSVFAGCRVELILIAQFLKITSLSF